MIQFMCYPFWFPCWNNFCSQTSKRYPIWNLFVERSSFLHVKYHGKKECFPSLIVVLIPSEIFNSFVFLKSSFSGFVSSLTGCEVSLPTVPSLGAGRPAKHRLSSPVLRRRRSKHFNCYVWCMYQVDTTISTSQLTVVVSYTLIQTVFKHILICSSFS